MANLDKFLQDHREQFETTLCELLRIPSVSADSRFKADIRRAAEWMDRQFRSLGFMS